MVDQTNTVVQLLISSTQAEFSGDINHARWLVWQGWLGSITDCERCMAAHYVARYTSNPEQQLKWNQDALTYAQRTNDPIIQTFLFSLYINLAQSYADLGNEDQAQIYRNLAIQYQLH